MVEGVMDAGHGHGGRRHSSFVLFFLEVRRLEVVGCFTDGLLGFVNSCLSVGVEFGLSFSVEVPNKDSIVSSLGVRQGVELVFPEEQFLEPGHMSHEDLNLRRALHASRAKCVVVDSHTSILTPHTHVLAPLTDSKCFAFLLVQGETG